MPSTSKSSELKNNLGISFNIHVLVAAAFLPPSPGKEYEIDHRDVNPANNLATNLRWATRSLNNLNRPQDGVGVQFNASCTDRPWGAFLNSRCIGRFADKASAIAARSAAYSLEIAKYENQNAT